MIERTFVDRMDIVWRECTPVLMVVPYNVAC